MSGAEETAMNRKDDTTVIKSTEETNLSSNIAKEIIVAAIPENSQENGQVGERKGEAGKVSSGADAVTVNAGDERQPTATEPATLQHQVERVLNEVQEQTKEENGVSNTVPAENETGSAVVTSEQDNSKEKSNEEQVKREEELLSKLAQLEKATSDTESLKALLKARENELEALKVRVRTLEAQLTSIQLKPSGNNKELVETLKQQHEELLNKARGMIFEKTKVVKNQELQIEALNAQVSSLKDVATITKDMLEIRNTEVKTLETRLETMENRFKCERDRQNLILKKAENGAALNEDLKKEYGTQLALFKELREKYDDRVKALVEENRLLNEKLGREPTTSA